MYYHKPVDGTNRRVWENTYWLGMRVQKNPMDLWNYQEIMVQTQPRVIIETGVFDGGSIFYLAVLGGLAGVEDVVGIDIEIRDTTAPLKSISNVTLIQGSSTDPAVVEQVRALAAGRPALVILDSDHARDHVLNEMRLYREFVPVGGYMIVEDSNVNSHPVYPAHGPGPHEAIHAFLEENDDFEIDKFRCEKFYLTFNPDGYLKRVK
jgi:cephalosporin hydroxylase